MPMEFEVCVAFGKRFRITSDVSGINMLQRFQQMRPSFGKGSGDVAVP
jgi:hypothetical protein